MVKSNYGMKGECILCNEEDSTEHLLTCPENKEDYKEITTKNLVEGSKMQRIVELVKATEKKRGEKMNEILEEEIQRHQISQITMSEDESKSEGKE